jgi:nicotinamide-nucleotide amidase
MPAEMYLRITAKADDYDTAYKMTEPVVTKICGILGDVVYGVDVDSLEDKLFKVMKEKKLTLALAESCTGGLISKRLTDMPGVSEIYLGGVCAYSNSLKEGLLGVSHETLEKFGAVSSETALEMARGVRERTKASVGASVTGIAGPDGGTAEKPVGLVYCALSMDGYEDCVELRTGGNRERVRNLSASTVLDLVLRKLEDRPKRD